MNKLYQHFIELGFTKKMVIFFSIAWVFCLIGFISIDEPIIMWIVILLPPLFIIAIIVLFYVGMFFDYFYKKLPLYKFVLFSIVIFIIWTSIFSIISEKFGSNILAVYMAFVVLGIDMYLFVKFLWNVQIENDPKKKMPSLTMFGETVEYVRILNVKKSVIVFVINCIIIGAFLFICKNYTMYRYVVREQNFAGYFLLFLFTHFAAYVLVSIKFNTMVLSYVLGLIIDIIKSHNRPKK